MTGDASNVKADAKLIGAARRIVAEDIAPTREIALARGLLACAARSAALETALNDCRVIVEGFAAGDIHPLVALGKVGNIILAGGRGDQQGDERV